MNKQQWLAFLKNMTKKNKGQSMVEYGLITALIALVCMGAFGTIGQNLNTTLGTIGTAIGG